MKKLIELYKNFKYKTIFAIGLIIVLQVIYWLTNIATFGIISLFFLGYIIAIAIQGLYHGIKNTYTKDGNRTEAIIVAVIASLLVFGAGFLIIYFVILGN